MFSTRTIYGEPIRVPCGTCITCRSSNQRFLSHRIQSDVANLSLTKGLGSSFVTLTYADDHASISKREFQLFMKRLRKNSPINCKYLAIGDYGGQTQRPHYHFIGIGLPSEYASTFCRKSWNKGFCDIEPAAAGNINYVVRYMSKQTKQYKESFSCLGIEQPFSLCSNGIGRSLFSKNEDLIRDSGRYYYKGRTYALTPYWLAKFGVLPTRPDFSTYIESARRNGFTDVQSYLNYKSYVKEMAATRKGQNLLKPAQGLGHTFKDVKPLRSHKIDISSLDF